MQQLEFYGAAGQVTGSCHILRAGGHTVLLDCGMIQGGSDDELGNEAEFPFDPAAVHAVILSHAHLDHSGRLPLLVKRGAIVIAGSGMCNGGRILHHFRRDIGRSETQIVFTGFQPRGTLGRRMIDGADSVRIYGRTISGNSSGRTHTSVSGTW